MELTILGSAGPFSAPRPLCFCKNCETIRSQNIQWARTGASLLVNQNIIFDTPAEIKLQLERERVRKLEHVFYTHWHPDHTEGSRIFEQINGVFPGERPKVPIKVYIPINAMRDFETKREDILHWSKRDFIRIVQTNDRTPVRLGKTTVIPLDFKRPDRIRYGYLIESNRKKALYAPCSVFDLFIDSYYHKLDLLIIDAGWLGKSNIRLKLPKNHYFRDHVSFEEIIQIVRKVMPKRTILTHMGSTRQCDGRESYQTWCKTVSQYKDLNIHIGYDSMHISL